MEMLYVVNGTIAVSIHNLSKELKEGDFAIIFPNTIHSYELNKTNTPCRILLTVCSLKLTNNFFKKITSNYPLDPFIPSEKLHENVGFAMTEIEKEHYHGSDLNVCSALIHLILSRTIPMLDLAKNQDLQNYDLTYKIASYVSEHFQENLTLTELANHLNVSKYYLSRMFSSKFNTSFNQYVNCIRVNYALTQMQLTDYTLTRISIDSGFESQRTFNRAFKEIFHLSPSEYRKRVMLPT
jgi:AraC-like DNA-binding protein